jgi:hypothetical protein
MAFNMSGFVRKNTNLEINGLELEFSELTLGDLAQFKVHLNEIREKQLKSRRVRILESVKMMEGKIEPSELLDKLDKPLTDAEVEAEAETIEGVCYLAWLSLRPNQPQITQDEVKKIIGIDDLEAVSNAMFPVNGEKKTNTKKRAKKSPGARR